MDAEPPRVAGGELGAGGAPCSRPAYAPRAQFGHVGEQPITELPAALIAAHQGRIDDARDRSERAGGRRHPGLSSCRAAIQRQRWQKMFVGDPKSEKCLEPGHPLDLADTLEALIAVGELAEAERKLVPWGEARPNARPIVGAGDHGSLPRAPPRRPGRSRGRPDGLRARARRACADSGSVSVRAYAARARGHAAASETAGRRPRDARAGARRLRAARRAALGAEGTE